MMRLTTARQTVVRAVAYAFTVERVVNIHLIRTYVMTPWCRHDSVAPASREHRAAESVKSSSLTDRKPSTSVTDGRDSGVFLRSPVGSLMANAAACLLLVAAAGCEPEGGAQASAGLTVRVDSARHIACYVSGVYGGSTLSCIALDSTNSVAALSRANAAGAR